MLEGFRQGSEGRQITVRVLCTAMRTAALSLQIAELAVRWRDEGVCGFDIAGAEAGYPPTRHLDAFQYVMRENFHITIHAGEAFGLPSIWEALQFCGAERLGHGVRIVDDIVADIAVDGGTPKLGRLASYVRDLRVPLEMCPSSNVHSGAARSIEEHPIGLLSELRFRVTVNTDNRLMSHITMSRRVREARRRVRLGLERDPLGDDQRHEERVPARSTSACTSSTRSSSPGTRTTNCSETVARTCDARSRRVNARRVRHSASMRRVTFVTRGRKLAIRCHIRCLACVATRCTDASRHPASLAVGAPMSSAFARGLMP